MSSLWKRLTEPAAVLTDPELRRRTRMILSILVIVGILWCMVFFSNPLQALADLSPQQSRMVKVIFPGILLAFAPFLVLAYFLARRGHPNGASRILVSIGSAGSFYYIFSAGDASGLSMPVLAVVLCSLLLSPLDTFGCVVITVAGYLLLPTFVPSLNIWDVYGTLIVVGSAGALCTGAVYVRSRDLDHIQKQADELARNHEQIVGAQKMEAVARLSAGVGHEFNNILAVINGYAEIIERSPTTSPAKSAARIREASLRAVKLTDGLLAFSQQQLMHVETTDLDKLLKSHEERLKSTLRTDTSLSILSSPETKIVELDTGIFCDAMGTLVRTAEKNLPAQGEISIETQSHDLGRINRLHLPPGRYCFIDIRDNGQVGDREVMTRLFDPFFTTGEFGTGNLELAAAYGIVRQSGGQVELRSDREIGNSIVVVVPNKATSRS